MLAQKTNTRHLNPKYQISIQCMYHILLLLSNKYFLRFHNRNYFSMFLYNVSCDTARAFWIRWVRRRSEFLWLRMDILFYIFWYFFFHFGQGRYCLGIGIVCYITTTTDTQEKHTHANKCFIASQTLDNKYKCVQVSSWVEIRNVPSPKYQVMHV